MRSSHRSSTRQIVEPAKILGGLTFAGTIGLLGSHSRPAAAEPAPETSKLRVHHSLSLCLAPRYVAEEIFRAEGFTEVRYVTHEESGGLYEGLASGAADIGNDFAPMLIMRVEAGDPITILGGVHIGWRPLPISACGSLALA